jgi:mono/diheme cytochrome c family protein
MAKACLRCLPPGLGWLALPLALAVAGCDRPPSAGSLKEWTPADHDRAEEQSNQANQAARPPPQSGGAGAGPGGGRSAKPSPDERPEEKPQKPARSDGGDRQLVEVTWETACAPCHGPTGHGDGPNGPMVNAPDITRDDLLSKITDDEIASQIRNGKNRMPKFDLPDPVVRGLVARIRAMRGR